MTLVSYQVTQQPYYYYVQYLAYNVIGGIIQLVFSSPASTSPTDYKAIAKGGLYSDSQFQFGFDYIDDSLIVDNDTVTLQMPTVIGGNCYVELYYQGSQLPIILRADEDYRYTQPAIFRILPYQF